MAQTFKKKVISASVASAFILVGGGVVSIPVLGNVSAAQAATTTTVGMRLDTDQAALSANNRTLNIAITGLDLNGNVDTLGGSGGSYITAEITSSLGTAGGAAALAGGVGTACAAAGAFASTTGYVGLTQGRGMVNVVYAASVSGTDQVAVRLLECRKDAGGNATTVAIASQTLSITVPPAAATAGVLDIEDFTVSGSDGREVAVANAAPANEGADDGIAGTARLAAGVSGSTFTIKAYRVNADRTYTLDTNASGTVTVTLTGDSSGVEGLGNNRASSTDTYTITGTMSGGTATVTVPATITKAGLYKVVASMGTMTSVSGKVNDSGDTFDKVQVIPKLYTALAKISLASNRAVVSNIADAGDTIAATAVNDGFDNRVTFTGKLLDTYGNMVDPTGAAANTTIKVVDANSKISDFNLTVLAGANTSAASGLMTDLHDSFSTGTASLTATIPANTLIPASTAITQKIVANTNQLCTIADGAAGFVLPNAATTAGTALTNFFTGGVGVDANNGGICAGAELNTLTATNRLKITSMTAVNGAYSNSVTVSVKDTNPDNTDALFTIPVTNVNVIANGIAVADADGSYADTTILTNNAAFAVAAASPNTAQVRDAQGNVKTSMTATANADGTFTAVLHGSHVRLVDAYGNANSNGSMTVVTSKGVVTGTVTADAAGDPTFDAVATAGNLVTITYPAGTTGSDTLTLSFTQPGITSGTSFTVNFPTPQALTSFGTYADSTSLMTNGITPLTIIPQDASGNMMSVADGYIVEFNAVGLDVENTACGANLVNGGNLGAATGRYVACVKANTTPGTYRLTVKNTAGTVTKDVDFVVSLNQTPVAPSTGATVTGAITSQTITATLAANNADVGKTGSTYVVGNVPNVGLFFNSKASGAWTLWNGTSAGSAPYESGVTLSTYTIPVVPTAMDLTLLVGTDVIVGYGIGGVFSTNAQIFENMVTNTTYWKVHTIAN